MDKPIPEHTCHGNEHMPPGPCVACEVEKAAYEAECARAEAEQAQEAEAQFMAEMYRDMGETGY